MRPRIGMPQCLDVEGRIREGREYLYIDAAYSQAIERAGALALHLPVQAGAAELVDQIDGLLLPGGDDFLPESPYPDDVRFSPAAPRQIGFDRQLLICALERGIPILGICYGAQLIAIHHGGTLHYHLPIDCPESQEHQLPGDVATHGIEIESSSRLARCLGQRVASVNSLHHQAIETPGDAMSVCARSPDGVVEAVEGRGDGFCLGVQWHPEKLPGDGSDALFRALVDACRKD